MAHIVHVTVHVGAGHSPIVFLSTGFIYGERYKIDFQDTETSGAVGTYHDSRDNIHATVRLTKDQATQLWDLADKNVRSGIFRVKEPRPERGADMGYSTVYYKGLTAEPLTMPDVVSYVKQIFPGARNLAF